MTEKRFYDIHEAEAISCLSAKTLRNRRYAGLPPKTVRIGGKILFPIADFEAWLRGEAERGSDDARP